MGHIYIIKNTLNDKVYIGQTSVSTEKRWRQHKYAASNVWSKSKLYLAMRELGVDNFYIEELFECENKDLNKAEIETIAKYNSFLDGYNSTIGGEGGTNGYEPPFLEDLILDYKLGMTQIDLCIKYHISVAYLVELTKGIGRVRHGTRSDKSISSNQDIKLYCYDSKFNLEQIFENPLEAYVHTKYANTDVWDFLGEISIACYNGNMAYGHRWQREDEIDYDGKLFRSIFDRDKYKEFSITTINSDNMYCCDGAIDHIVEVIKCAICGKELDERRVLCNDCKIKYYNRINGLDDSKKIDGIRVLAEGEQRFIKGEHSNGLRPSKSELLELMQNNSYEAIGRMYGISGKAVSKWAKAYDIYERRISTDKEEKTHKTIVGYFKTRKAIQFVSTRDAARYLFDTGRSNPKDLDKLAYEISLETRKNGYKYGFRWTTEQVDSETMRELREAHGKIYNEAFDEVVQLNKQVESETSTASLDISKISDENAWEYL